MTELDATTKRGVDVQFKNNWKVIMYNDDTTSQICVMQILVKIFQYNVSSAYTMMDYIEQHDSGVVAILPKKLAEKRMNRALDYAKQCGYEELRIEMEEDE